LVRDFVQFEIKIGPFARLLAVKIALRAFADFVETDDEEVGLGARFPITVNELTLLLILHDACTMKQAA